jgi:hypothetical protein
LLYLITRERKPAANSERTGNAIAVEIDVPSARNPIIDGPIKNPERPITKARALDTDGAMPGMALAARMNAGNIGPIASPAITKPMLIIIRAISGCESESGTAIAMLAPHPIPPK